MGRPTARRPPYDLSSILTIRHAVGRRVWRALFPVSALPEQRMPPCSPRGTEVLECAKGGHWARAAKRTIEPAVRHLVAEP